MYVCMCVYHIIVVYFMVYLYIIILFYTFPHTDIQYILCMNLINLLFYRHLTVFILRKSTGWSTAHGVFHKEKTGQMGIAAYRPG